MKRAKRINNTAYFKRWTRKNYAVFNSLHQLVAISTLSVVCSILTYPNKAHGQDTILKKQQLKEIEIQEERPLLTDNATMVNLQLSVTKTDIERQKPPSLTNLLKHLQGLDIRQRGPFGTQTDISFRGGNFDQTSIFLNGINFTDPQTGHYSLNLPIAPEIISKIEIFKNTTPYLFGSPSFSGMVNIITEPEDSNHIRLSVNGGMYGLVKAGATGNFNTKHTKHLLHIDYERSDGYTENTDFKNLNTFYFGKYQTKIGIFESQLGYVNRNYGANGFYSLKYPKQHDSTQTFLTSIRFINKGSVKVIPAIYYRLQKDCYALIKGQARERNNFHRSQVLGGNLLTYFYSIIGKTSFVVDYKIENIVSTGLGVKLNRKIEINGEKRLFYQYGYTRQHYGFGLKHNFFQKNLSGDIALNVQHNTDNHKKFYWLPSFNLSYDLPISKSTQIPFKHRIYLLTGKTMRMPTFTDLFYHTGDIIGNQNLEPEQAITVELGYHYNLLKKDLKTSVLKGEICIFQRYGKNMIDFIKEESGSVWHCVNHTKITTTGIEISASFYPQSVIKHHCLITDISLSYAYLYSDKSEDLYLSRYVLDYLRHKLTLSLTHTLIKNLFVNYRLTYQSRIGKYQNTNGQYESYPNYALLDISVQYQYKNWNFHIEANNVFNIEYFDIGGLLQPGFWLMGGIQYRINL